MSGISKVLIISGAALVITGIVMYFTPRLPWLGRLPGDIYIKRGDSSFYFPISTCIVISIIISAVAKAFWKR